MTPRQIKRYGWRQSSPDPRDIRYQVAAPISLPPSFDLREKCPPVYNQGQTGSCTGNAWAAAYEFLRPGWMPSRLFIYYCERAYEGNTKMDGGAMLRDGAKALSNFGTCSENTWAFSEDAVTVQPSNAAYIEGLNNKISQYQSIPSDLDTFKQCIVSGLPFVFGFTVFSSFESQDVANTGIMPMPNLKTEVVKGGHAIMAAGYDDSKEAVLIRNSWGEDWGENGYFWMPYDYISNQQFASDFWCIKSI